MMELLLHLFSMGKVLPERVPAEIGDPRSVDRRPTVAEMCKAAVVG